MTTVFIILAIVAIVAVLFAVRWVINRVTNHVANVAIRGIETVVDRGSEEVEAWFGTVRDQSTGEANDTPSPDTPSEPPTDPPPAAHQRR